MYEQQGSHGRSAEYGPVPPHPAPGGNGAPPEQRNRVATAALSCALVALVVGILWVMARPTLAFVIEADVSARVMVDAVAMFVVALVSVIALVLGLISLGKRSHRARAGIAIGIGMYATVNAIVSFAATFVAS